MNALTFGAPQWFWAMLALPLLALLFVRGERGAAARLGQFVAPRLLPQLGAAVNRSRRAVRFGVVLAGIALAITALAQPRWGYTYEEVKRKGLDLLVAVDTSRSMLANDVPPNRLQRVKLAVQDLLTELRGDRIGLIAFAGRAFLQAPLTIDYDAAAEALNDLDTETIPEGGTNISEAIDLATRTFGKSAMGNRALIIFTDGEDLSGDSLKVAKAAADAGVRIFTVGVGTPEGSLIPLPGQGGGTAFVKDSNGQVVKSKLDEKRLREIAEATGGIFLPLGQGPATMRQLYADGLSKLQASDIDARVSRQPIERYQWPLGAAILFLASSLLISERGRVRRVSPAGRKTAPLAAAAFLLMTICAQAVTPGLEAYRSEQYDKAYQEFQETLQAHPNTAAEDKLHFDAGAAAYKMKDYNKALQSFSQALLSPDLQLQSRSHYNLGNTLYQRGEAQKAKDAKLQDWTNALQHYEQTLKAEPENREAQENRDFVQNKIDELKREEQQQPTPTPTPTPSPSPSPNQKDQNKDQQQKKDGEKKPDENKDQQQQKDSEGKGDQQQPSQGPSPSPTPDQQPSQGSSPTPSPSPSPSAGGSSPSPSPGEQTTPSPSASSSPSSSPSPSPSRQGSPSPSPSSGEGENGQGGDASPTPSATPGDKKSGEVKGAGEEPSPTPAEAEAEAESTQEGQMTEQQAERLLRSMKDEEQRVQLDERKHVRPVYKDW
ncbi:MAG: vWA domain-containing protein [Chthoniobacterales bacterium]